MPSSYEIAKSFGYMTKEEIHLLKAFALSLPYVPLIVNIGAGSGTSGLALVEERQDAVVFTVDISEGGPYGGLENERNAFKDSGLRLPFQILGDSKDVGKNWRHKVDMVFVDGDHIDQVISNDIASWKCHVRDGGIMAFHDYGADVWPAVKDNVDKSMSSYPVIGFSDTLIGFRIAQ